MVTVYKVEMMVIDHDGLGESGVISVVENTHYPNRCIAPSVMSIDSRSVEWSDEHPLNKTTTQVDAFRALF